ncbi:MAG: alpha/beta fold hydrolase [Bacteroidia bacterium]
MKSIIFLHGAIGASDQLEPLANALKSRYSVFTFSFSGHGKTTFDPEGFGIGIFAKELQQFIEKHQLEKPDVFGYSMGGYVALYLAAQQPGLIGSIITLGTKFTWSPEIAAGEVKMLDAKTISEKVPKFAEALKVRHGNEWEELLQKTAEMMKGLGDKNLLDANTLSGIKSKVLIGLADNDNMVSLEETTAAYKSLPNAGMYMLPFSKHPIESVNLNYLANLLSSFC